MTRALKNPYFPRRKHRRHENGVLTFSELHEGWQPTPTPAEAHARFAELGEHWQDHPSDEDFTAQLIVRGEVADEIAIPRRPS